MVSFKRKNKNPTPATGIVVGGVQTEAPKKVSKSKLMKGSEINEAAQSNTRDRNKSRTFVMALAGLVIIGVVGFLLVTRLKNKGVTEEVSVKLDKTQAQVSDALTEGNGSAAVDAVQEQLKDGRLSDVERRSLLLQAAEFSENSDEAKQFISQAEQLGPEDRHILMVKARLAVKNKDQAAAEGFLDKAQTLLDQEYPEDQRGDIGYLEAAEKIQLLRKGIL